MENLNERIQKKAYSYFIERGMSHGRDFEDWLKAEKEILLQSRNKKNQKKIKTTVNSAVSSDMPYSSELPVCLKATEMAEHQRFADDDEPCDDGRSGV